MSLATGFHGAKGFLSLGRILLCCSARVARRAAGRQRTKRSGMTRRGDTSFDTTRFDTAAKRNGIPPNKVALDVMQRPDWTRQGVTGHAGIRCVLMRRDKM